MTLSNPLVLIEIIGCCEVIEERLDTTQTNSSLSERERRKSARPRPVIENLCVAHGYRRSGIAIALVHACEKAVRPWLGHDEVFAQVEDNNAQALRLFRKCGYQPLFADPTCTKVILDDTLLAKEINVTKLMMRKILDDGNEFVF